MARFRETLRLLRQSWYDFRRYQRHGMTFQRTPRRAHVLAHISIAAHEVERMLALPDFALGRGQRHVIGLCRMLESYLNAGHEPRRPEVLAALGALASYRERHHIAGFPLDEVDSSIDRTLSRFFTLGVKEGNGGVEHATADSLVRHSTVGARFLQTRHSTRQFSHAPIDPEQIAAAVSLAQRAPSVCNRQAGRVHIFNETEKARAVLAHQVGNGGFGHQVPAVAVVTTDLRCFSGAKERNQSFIDGGLFAMCFLLGLHAQGLAACPLNWSVYWNRDQALRRTAGIPDHENIIMLVAFGHYPDHFTYAKSTRLRTSDVATFH